MRKNPTEANLKRNGQNDKHYNQEGTPPKLQVDEVGDHTQVEGSKPEYMGKKECL